MEIWKRNLYVIWAAELAAASGFSVVMPFLPYYVQDLGVTELHEVELWSGVLLAIQAVTMTIFAPIWGSVADRYGCKLMVQRAVFGGAAVITAMGFVGNVWQLALLRAIQGTLTGTVAAATTLVASSVPRERSGYALGLLQTAVWLGQSLGPLLGGLVADTWGYRAAFYVTGTPGKVFDIAIPLRVRRIKGGPLLVGVEGQVMPILHLFQIEVERPSSQGAVLVDPSICEQDAADIQKQRRDRDCSFHLASINAFCHL